MDRAVLGWAVAGGIAYALLPWYAIEDGIFGFGWLSGYPTDRAGCRGRPGEAHTPAAVYFWQVSAERVLMYPCALASA